ncbi:hypothetical protein ACTFIZ_007614 [Dictyostelium cf. discoideum]
MVLDGPITAIPVYNIPKAMTANHSCTPVIVVAKTKMQRATIPVMHPIEYLSHSQQKYHKKTDADKAATIASVAPPLTDNLLHTTMPTKPINKPIICIRDSLSLNQKYAIIPVTGAKIDTLKHL